MIQIDDTWPQHLVNGPFIGFRPRAFQYSIYGGPKLSSLQLLIDPFQDP
jgi:hypothetical protein